MRPKSVVEVLHLPMPDGLQSLFQRRLGRRTLKRLRHRRSINMLPSQRHDRTWKCDAILSQYIGKGKTGKLTALIDVEHIGITVFGQGSFQGRNAKIRVHGTGRPSRQYLSAS